MHIKNPKDVTPFESPHGEVVRELGGAVDDSLIQHSVAHITLKPHSASLKHYHPEAEESYVMLSGQARVVIDGETQLLNVGDMVAIKSPQVHQIFNDTDQDVVFLAMCAPPWTPTCSVFLDEN